MTSFGLLGRAWYEIRTDLGVVPAQIPVQIVFSHAVHGASPVPREYATGYCVDAFPLHPFLEPGRISRYSRDVLSYYDRDDDVDWDTERYLYEGDDYTRVWVYEYTHGDVLMSYVVERRRDVGVVSASLATESPPDWFMRLCSDYTSEHLPRCIPRLQDLTTTPIRDEVVRFLDAVDEEGLRLVFLPCFRGDRGTDGYIRPGQRGFVSLRSLLENTEWDEFNVAVSSLVYVRDDVWYAEAGVIVARYRIERDDKIRLLSGIDVREYVDLEEIGEYTNV
ncbi:MAG: hypothetical protein V2G41_09955 [bacterium JZ-2024 1]